ncbi:MAG: hypothetical protein EXR75_05320 [Myxococcales bacterium]|nr:hypothetical protein [Myxococcales bacterium]
MSAHVSRLRLFRGLTIGACLSIAATTHATSIGPATPDAVSPGAPEPASPEAASPEAGSPDPAAAGPALPDLGQWGVGGAEEEGKFKPSGKTGKLKELEEEHKVEEVEAGRTATDLGPPGSVYVDMAFIVGGGSIVVPVQDSGATSVSPAASYLIGVGYRFAKKWEATMRFGVSTAAINGPRTPIVGTRDPDSYKQIATGGFELAFAPHYEPFAGVVVQPGLALTIPTGMGDLFATVDNRAELAQAVVNEAVSAARGWEERAIFTHDRFAFTPSGRANWEKPMGMGIVAVEGGLKLDVMIRTAGNDPAPPSATQSVGVVNGVAVNVVAGGGAFYRMFDGLLEPGLRLWLAVATPTDEVGTIGNGGSTFVIEPNIRSRIALNERKSMGLEGRLAWTLPVSGSPASGIGDVESAVWGQRLTLGFFY